MKEKKICLVTVVDSIAATSMPVNEFVLYRNRKGYGYRQVMVSCTDEMPENVAIPSDIEVHLVGQSKDGMREVLKAVQKECDKRGENITIHLHAQKSAVLFFRSSVGLGLRRKTLFTIHSSFSSRDLKYKISSCLCVLLANYANCVSCSAFEAYSAWVKKMKGSRMLAIRNGVDDERIAESVASLPKHNDVRNMRKMACVGRIIPIKNQEFLIRLMKDLPDTELLLIGKEDEAHELRMLAQREGVSERVTFTGLLPRDEVFRRLNTCGMYVSASLVEGLPVSVLEAMCVGLIPVISDIAPHKEIAEECKLFRAIGLNEEDWVRTIKAYQQMDAREANDLSGRIQKSVSENFSLRAMHERYNEIYKKIIRA